MSRSPWITTTGIRSSASFSSISWLPWERSMEIAGPSSRQGRRACPISVGATSRPSLTAWRGFCSHGRVDSVSTASAAATPSSTGGAKREMRISRSQQSPTTASMSTTPMARSGWDALPAHGHPHPVVVVEHDLVAGQPGDGDELPRLRGGTGGADDRILGPRRRLGAAQRDDRCQLFAVRGIVAVRHLSLRLHHKPRAGRVTVHWSAAEDVPDPVHVTPGLLDQGLDRVELPVLPDAGHEPHLHVLVVQVAVEVEQVRLEQADVGLHVEGGPAPQVDGAGVDRAVGALEPAGVDAVGGQQDVAGHRDVRGREPQLAAPLVAAGHHTPHLVVPAQQAVGRGHLALDQGVADAGRRHKHVLAARAAVGPDQLQALDLEPQLGAQLAQQRHVAGAPVPEVEVLAHHHVPGVEAVDQDLLDEVLGRLPAHEPDHRAVTKVDAVVGADGDHRALGGRWAAGLVAQHLHRRHSTGPRLAVRQRASRLSSAWRRSATRSAAASMPTDSRTRPGSTANGDPAADAWVMRAGCSMSDSTAPSDSASVNRRVGPTRPTAASSPPPPTNDTMPPASRLWRLATSAPGGSGSPGHSTRSTAGCSASSSTTTRALSQWRSMRTASVLSPRSTRKQSNGEGTAPAAFCTKPMPSASSGSSVTVQPPTTSECPPRYLVALWTTTSAPSASGCCR